MTYVRDILLALWYGVAVFALGFFGSYLLLTKTADVLPAWVTLGGSAVVAVWVAVYSAYTEIRDTREVRKRINRPRRTPLSAI